MSGSHRPDDDAHGHDGVHDHEHGRRAHRGLHDHGDGRDHEGPLRQVAGRLFGTHSHDHADAFDPELAASRAGTRALWLSFAGLLATAGAQAAVVATSGSVGLLADTIHNGVDALSAVPIGIAFVLGRRAPTRSYTFGYGRAEDLAGLAVVALIAASVAAAGWEAIAHVAHPRPITHIPLVVGAGAIGFVGNELIAEYRIRVGRRIGSAALVADGIHARADGFTSLAVIGGALGVGAGWRLADPVVGICISVAVLVLLTDAARRVLRRLLDAVDPALTGEVRHVASEVRGVLGVGDVRLRWIGHSLFADLEITVDRHLSIVAAHEVAEEVQHALLHGVHRLVIASVHVNPSARPGDDPHARTSHHFPKGNEAPA